MRAPPRRPRARGSVRALGLGSLQAPRPTPQGPRLALLERDGATSRIGEGGPPLALAGAIGPEADRLAAEAWRRHVPLVLCGPVEDHDLASLYRQAAVVALPSTHEGFGLTALEAMACGAPLVATAVEEPPAADPATWRCWIVPSEGPAPALAGAIESVLGEPVRAARMRHAGVDRAAELHLDERTAALTAAVYEEVARHHSGAALTGTPYGGMARSQSARR